MYTSYSVGQMIFLFISTTAGLSAQKKQPPYLQKGDTLAIVAPSGALKEKDNIYKAVALAESWGLSVVLGDYIFEKNGHFAGTDLQRTKDLQRFLDDVSVKALWCARGGYGSVRIIDRLDFKTFQNKPKWIIGYSDITVFHNHLNAKGMHTLHAMMPTDLNKNKSEQNVSTLQRALFGKPLLYEFSGHPKNIEGQCVSELVGGNLTLLAAMVGSPSQVDTRGKIVFLEEIGEYQYHLDRMLRTLDRSGVFKNCKGVLVGSISKVKPNKPGFGQSVEDMITQILRPYGIPVAFGVPVGHHSQNWAMPLGRKVHLRVGKNKTMITFD